MARKNPLDKLRDAAIDTLKNPRGAAEKAIGQAKGTAALGKMVAEQVGKTAITKAVGTAGAIVAKATSRGRKPTPRAPGSAPRAESQTHLRPVPDVDQPARTPAPAETPARSAPAAETPAAKPAPAEKAPATKVAAQHATPADVAKAVKKAPAKKAPAKKAAAKKATAKKAVAKKTPAEPTSPGDKLPPRKPTAEVPEAPSTPPAG